MDGIWLWILISVVIGVVAGLIFINATKTRDDEDVYSNDEDIDNDDAGDDDADDDGGESLHRTRNFFLVVSVFSVLAFLIVWLVMALFNEPIGL